MAARKKTGRKTGTKTGRETAKSRTARVRDGTDDRAALPISLEEFSRKVRRDLTRLERKIETTRGDAVRQCTRVLRNVSHLLGRLAAAGEAEWRRSNEARIEATQAVLELEDAIHAQKARHPARKKTRRKARDRGDKQGSPRRRA